MSDASSLKWDRVSSRLAGDYHEFRTAARNWSGVYNTLQFGAAAMAAASALILKSEIICAAAKNDIGASLAAAATLAIAILTSGRFKEKWEANRLAAFAVRDLQYEMEKDKVDLDAILSCLQRVGIIRNSAILGTGASPKAMAGRDGED